MDEEKLSTNEDRRSFLGPDEKTKYYIAAPTAEDIRGADWTYSRMFTKSLMEGITTSHEMQDILMRRGVIGPEFEQRSAELAENLNNKIFMLEMSTDMESKRKLAIEVAQARDELYQWNQRLNGPMSNTCEQIADDARLEFLTACIIQDEDGNKVWDSYDTFLKEKSQSLALQARFQVMLYVQGMDEDIFDKTPEALAMKEVEADTLAKAEAVVKANEAVAKEEAEAEENKKTTRKTTNKTTSNKSTTKKTISSKKKTDEK